ncbi:exodeoxyribonuclease VII large subunit [Psychrilyobacter atlanticus]|uniref:exodeoxyribonuclease VII large subunit n=1 Tax=Psychrilyobacter atlanticus TaxID=271091 RepID=UPI00040812C0|nr:exodeoxyribonuclease VII large subunit [Psychrilyobacter atlanticus]
MKDRIFSVSQINKMVKEYLEGNDSFNNFFLKGEISGINYYKSGHLYFTLKDSKASVKCVSFGYKFKKIPEDLKEGDKIKLFGKVTLYEANGNYQILVAHVEKEGTLGKLFEELERTKRELAKEGYFDTKYKLPIPKLPQNIGIVTSGTGAAVKDIINTAKLRYENINIYVYPAKVQGIGSEDEIIKGIKTLDKMEEIDLIVAGRGGGSVEDLWSFNKKEVALAYFNTKTPIVSAVGHEIDNLLTDLTADMRASTPTHAAELVVPRKDLLMETLEDRKKKLNNSLLGNLQKKKEKLETLKRSYILRSYLETVVDRNNLLMDREDRLKKVINNSLIQKKYLLEVRMEKLRSLNPEGILKRGYTITKAGNKVIRGAGELEKGEKIEIIYHDGSVISRVEEIK